jgi:hypothetical protein
MSFSLGFSSFPSLSLFLSVLVFSKFSTYTFYLLSLPLRIPIHRLRGSPQTTSGTTVIDRDAARLSKHVIFPYIDKNCFDLQEILYRNVG